MQKVRYRLSFNSLYIKFHYLFNSSLKDWYSQVFSPLVHTTIRYRY